MLSYVRSLIESGKQKPLRSGADKRKLPRSAAEKAVRYSFQHGEAILKFGFRVCEPPMKIRAKLARILETHLKQSDFSSGRLEQFVFQQN